MEPFRSWDCSSYLVKSHAWVRMRIKLVMNAITNEQKDCLGFTLGKSIHRLKEF